MVLAESYRALGRHKFLIFAGTLVCVLVAVLLTVRAERLYEATAIVRIEPRGTTDANARFEAAQHLTQTYAEIYAKGALVPEMRTLLGPGVPVRIDDLTASQVKDLDLLAVSAQSTDPRQAAQIANAGTVAMERFSPDERIVQITAAAPPTSPASPKTELDIVIALIVGLTLNAALALLLDALRQPLPDADTIEREFDLPVLTQVPRLRFAPRASGKRQPPAEVHAAEVGG